MPRIPERSPRATDARRAPLPPRLAELAPAYATRVTVARTKTERGTVRSLKPTGRRHARPVEDFQFITPVTEGTGTRPGGVMWVLTVDMDDDASLLRICEADVPKPSWIIEKGINGHVQAGWIIDPVALGPKAHPRPIAYAEAVRAALTAAVGGDPHFTNRRQWNPTWTGWATEGLVIWGPTAPRTLGELHEELSRAGLWPTEADQHERRRTNSTARKLLTNATAGIQVSEGERNQFVFDYARLRPAGVTVADAAAEANTMTCPPLPAAEVAGIIRSIERYEARGGRTGGRGCAGEAYRQMQAARGRRGGTRGTTAQRAQRATAAARATEARSRKRAARATEARQKAARGWTTAQLAEHFRVTARTVRGWLSTVTKKAENTGASGVPRALPVGSPHTSTRHPHPSEPPTKATTRPLTPPPVTHFPGPRPRVRCCTYLAPPPDHDDG